MRNPVSIFGVVTPNSSPAGLARKIGGVSAAAGRGGRNERQPGAADKVQCGQAAGLSVSIAAGRSAGLRARGCLPSRNSRTAFPSLTAAGLTARLAAVLLLVALAGAALSVGPATARAQAAGPTNSAAPTGQTSPTSPANLFDAMQQAYAGMQSMRCEFEQTLLHRDSGSKTTRRGTLEFKKPLLARFEVGGDDAELLVVSAAEVWDYLPEEEVAYRYALDVVDRDNSFLKIVTGQANLSQDFEIAAETQVGDGTVEYHLYPFRPTQQLTEVYVRIEAANGPQRGVIRRVRIIDFFGNENDIRFLSSDLQADLSASRFSFTPPAGVDVEDNRNNPSASGPNLFQ